VEVNGQTGTDRIEMDAEVGKPIVLDASHSRDPDGQRLHYHWFHYAEAGAMDGALADVSISGADTAHATVTATAVCRPYWLPGLVPCPATSTAHIILAVTDEGSPPLTSYRRMILEVHAAPTKTQQ
jgi:hypothetical protein